MEHGSLYWARLSERFDLHLDYLYCAGECYERGQCHCNRNVRGKAAQVRFADSSVGPTSLCYDY